MEQTKLKRFKRIILIFGICFVLGIGLMISQISSGKTLNKPVVVELVDNEVINQDTISNKDKIQQQLVVEVENYIKKQSPKSHKFIPKYLVQAGLNHNIDICFMMAQTQVETNFGVGGAGRETSRRSMFGVAVKRYTSYEEAINDYCKILNKSYLGKGRTEKHLMSKYVTHTGLRYAATPNYEKELAKAYNDIQRKTNIYQLQLDWKSSL